MTSLLGILQEGIVSCSAASAVEVGDALDHSLLLFLCQLREHRQRQHFFRSAFGFREVAFAVSEIDEARLQVQWDGIVNFRPNLSGGKKLAQVFTAIGAYDILVKNVVSARGSMRQLKRSGVFTLRSV